MSTIKKLCICAICVAFCYVLPLVLHPFGLGQMLSPLHIPVMVCGLICGPIYGVACGILGPLVSSILSGMPPMIALTSMIPELVAYGFFCGILMKVIRTKSLLLNVYLSLIPAMILGRVIGGLAKALFYVIGVFGVSSFSVGEIASAYFVATLPGIIVHLLFIPLLVAALKEEKLIKVR